jgi:aryl-alcohol dehydrogenase-like predicted oxidoreductase
VARWHGVSAERVAIAWEPALSPAVIPIPGATRPETILDSVRAADLVLATGDLGILGGITAGPRPRLAVMRPRARRSLRETPGRRRRPAQR